MPLNVVQIALCCHELNRAYCGSIGDDSQLSWDEAAEWQKQSAVDGVRTMLAAGPTDAQAAWESWAKHKRADGWTYGPVKNDVARTHPCLVDSWDQVPQYQRLKDYLFLAVVEAFQKAAR